MVLSWNVYLSKCGESESWKVGINGVPSNGDYFYLSSLTSDYYLWFGTTDPSPGGGRVGIQVNPIGATVDEVVVNIAKALNAKGPFISWYDTTADETAWSVKKPGNVTDATNPTADADFTLTKRNEGVSVDPTLGPEQGERGIDYIFLTVKSIQDSMKSKNLKRHMVNRISFRVPLGKIQYGMALKGITILDPGEPNEPRQAAASKAEITLAIVKRFLNDANTIGGSYILHLFVYNPMMGSKYHPFIDQNDAVQNYYRCTIDGSKWKFQAKDLAYEGNITLDECWTGS